MRVKPSSNMAADNSELPQPTISSDSDERGRGGGRGGEAAVEGGGPSVRPLVEAEAETTSAAVDG